jgi:hypothetical protein
MFIHKEIKPLNISINKRLIKHRYKILLIINRYLPWGLGIGDWAQTPKPKTPNPKPKN